MSPKTRTFLSLSLNLLPCLLWAIALIGFGIEVGSEVKSELHPFYLPIALFAYLVRMVLNLVWLVHMLRNPNVDQIHKVFWALGLMLEGFFSACLGAFGVVCLMYWYKQVYTPYKNELLYGV